MSLDRPSRTALLLGLLWLQAEVSQAAAQVHCRAWPEPGAPPQPVEPVQQPRLPWRDRVTAYDSGWTAWWAFNRDRFCHERPRAPLEVEPEVVRVGLIRVLGTSTEPALTATCLLALGEIGRDPRLATLLARRLADRDPLVAESAILALGISAEPLALSPLLQVAHGTRSGRRLLERDRVGSRRRSFALHALGLLGSRCRDEHLRRRVVACLRAVLREPGTLDEAAIRELRGAAILGLSLCGGDTTPGSSAAGDALETLLELDRNHPEPDDCPALAQLPIAIARLLGRGDSPRHQAFKDRLTERLESPRQYARARRSAVLALGGLVRPGELRAADAWYSAALHRAAAQDRDSQTRSFALIALGEIGGAANRDRLSSVLTVGRKGLERPWAALGLAILESRRQADSGQPDRATGELLLRQLRDVKSPDARAAFAIALGICRYRPATPIILEMLAKYPYLDGLAPHLCTALALLDAVTARDRLLELVEKSARRPRVLAGAAPALARLGHPAATRTLLRNLRRPGWSMTGVPEALGYLRDRPTIDALLRLVLDDSLAAERRADAAAALGRIGEPDRLPWCAGLTAGVNYLAVVPTLVGGRVGVFERF